MARILYDDLEFCADCTMVAVTGDATSLDYHYSESEASERHKAICDGLDDWARKGTVVPLYDVETGEGIDEFRKVPCDCCGSRLYGSRHIFGILE